MKAAGKTFGVMALCLGVAALAWVNYDNSSSTGSIEVQVQALTPIVTAGEQSEIVVQAEANGTRVSHGEVMLDFYPLDWKTSGCFPGLWNIRGYTDSQGKFIANWKVPCAGKYMMCVKVQKRGYAAGRSISYLTAPDRAVSAETLSARDVSVAGEDSAGPVARYRPAKTVNR